MHRVVFKTRMNESDSSMNNKGQSAETDSMKMENRTISVESEDILSSELTTSDSDARISELRANEYSLCSSCLDSCSCFTVASLDEASHKKRSKNLSGFSSQT